jgi:uncharacterized protein DUF1194
LAITFARHVLLASALAWLSMTPANAQTADVDLEIVLAVDASGSVDGQEFRLQLDGTAAALRDPLVQAAIVSGPYGRVAVSLMVWSDSAFPRFATEWVVLDSPETATRFADVVETFYSKVGRSKGIGGGGTAIGDAVAYAIGMIDGNGINALRRVVDVSGDGIETPPWFGTAILLPQARRMAVERDVLVNGLAITTDFSNLHNYYRDQVIVGTGSFVIEALGFADFKRAMREKLQREFTFAVTSQSDPGKGENEVALMAD